MTAPPLTPHDPGRPLLPGAVEQYLVTRVPVCAPGDRAGEVRTLVLHGTYELVDDVALCEAGAAGPRLVGLLPLERLLAAADDAVVLDLADTDPPVVAPGLDQEHAAWTAVGRGESSLAVVDAAGTFQGLVPPARLLGVLLREHDEDFARLGGYLASTATARAATEEPLTRRLWHRLPWLAVGLLGSVASAALMDGAHAQLTADVRVAYFVPGVVYLADAIGTQTEALVIRGLSVGASVRRAFRLESLTGLVIGLLLGAVAFPLVLWAFGPALAWTVALALLGACAVATVVAMLLPWAMARAGRDPAFGSGPLATVVQDLLSLAVYLTLASLLL